MRFDARRIFEVWYLCESEGIFDVREGQGECGKYQEFFLWRMFPDLTLNLEFFPEALQHTFLMI